MRVLCVAAHPDDEVIGVGGTLAKHAAEGDEVFVLLLGDGEMARYETLTLEAEAGRARRRDDARRVGELLGFESVRILDFWGNQLDKEPFIDVVRAVEDEIQQIRPTVVYTHHFGDLNMDHQLTARAVKTATRPFADSTVDRVLSFETLSSTEWAMPTAETAFQPTVAVDIEPYLEQKEEALTIYEDEMRDRPHPRTIDSIVQNGLLWGDKFGLHAAEPFVLLLDRRR